MRTFRGVHPATRTNATRRWVRCLAACKSFARGRLGVDHQSTHHAGHLLFHLHGRNMDHRLASGRPRRFRAQSALVLGTIRAYLEAIGGGLFKRWFRARPSRLWRRPLAVAPARHTPTQASA